MIERDIIEEKSDDRPVLDPAIWVQTSMEPRKGKNISWREAVIPAYRAAAEAQGMKPGSDNALSRALGANGYSTKRISQQTMVLSAQIREMQVSRLKVV